MNVFDISNERLMLKDLVPGDLFAFGHSDSWIYCLLGIERRQNLRGKPLKYVDITYFVFRGEKRNFITTTEIMQDTRVIYRLSN